MSTEAWAGSGEAWTRWVRPVAERWRGSRSRTSTTSRAVAEAGRVLVAGGRLCFAVFHPVCAFGRFEGDRLVIDEYFEEGPWVTNHDADGMPLTIHSHRYTLGTHVRAVADAGLAIETVDETPFQEPWSTFPLVLSMRARKP